jgi:hypothetical protein
MRKLFKCGNSPAASTPYGDLDEDSWGGLGLDRSGIATNLMKFPPRFAYTPFHQPLHIYRAVLVAAKAIFVGIA